MDVREFDSEYEFILALKIPEHVEFCDWTTELSVFVEPFKWNVSDVAFLVEDIMPVHHPSILDAGFSEKEILRLANPRHSAADYIEGLETHAGYERNHHKVGSSIGGKIRNEVLHDDGYTCVFCGKTRPDVVLHVHHVIPRSIIKKLHLNEALHICRWNLVCACMECNLGKSDTLAPQDVKFLIKQMESGHLKKNLKLLPVLNQFRDLRQSDGS